MRFSSAARAQGDDKLVQLLERLAHPNLHAGGEGTVEKLLYALTNETNDRALDHSLTYALIEIGDVKAEILKAITPGG